MLVNDIWLKDMPTGIDYKDAFSRQINFHINSDRYSRIFLQRRREANGKERIVDGECF